MSISLDIGSNRHPLIHYILACYINYVDSLPKRFCPIAFFSFGEKAERKVQRAHGTIDSFPLPRHLERIASVWTKKYFF